MEQGWTSARVTILNADGDADENVGVFQIPVFKFQDTLFLGGDSMPFGECDERETSRESPAASLYRIGPQPDRGDNENPIKPTPPNGWRPVQPLQPGDTGVIVTPRGNAPPPPPAVGDKIVELTVDANGNIKIITHTVVSVVQAPPNVNPPGPGDISVGFQPPWDGAIGGIIGGPVPGPIIIRPAPKPGGKS